MPGSESAVSITRTFASLRHRNYRLWFYGQMFSLVGTWMQNTAQAYLIYELTGSPAFLGLAAFLGGLPTWLFTLYGGIIADRFSRRSLLLVTQTSAMLLAFILAFLVATGLVQPWMILIMAFLLGTVNAFEGPVRISFVRELVDDKADMTNAIALNATMFNTAAFVGPAIGGLIYAAVGPAWCFSINGVSFIAVLIALTWMRLAPLPPQPQRASAVTQLKEGLKYAAEHPTIRYLILAMGVMSMCGFGLFALMPAWAKEILNGDAGTNGLLNSARGLGSLLGALMVASFSYMKMRGKMWTTGSFVLPVCGFLFAISTSTPLALIMLMGMGWSLMMIANINNAIIQMEVPDHLRGRVMSIYTLVFQGFMPIGSLIAGAAASQFSEPITVFAGAGLLLIFAVVTWLVRPDLRRME
jgi:MFS family permease